MQQQQFDQLTTAEKREVERQLHLYMDGAEEVIPPEELRAKLAKSILSGEPLKLSLASIRRRLMFIWATPSS